MAEQQGGVSPRTSLHAEPPTNVQIRWTDDTVTPVDCLFAGWLEEVAIWSVIMPSGRTLEQVAAVKADKLPLNTAIEVG